MSNTDTAAARKLAAEAMERAENKCCVRCRHATLPIHREPCATCDERGDSSGWEPSVETKRELALAAAVTALADEVEELRKSRLQILSEFVEAVERDAEAKMLATGKLEGAHYAAMKAAVRAAREAELVAAGHLEVEE